MNVKFNTVLSSVFTTVQFTTVKDKVRKPEGEARKAKEERGTMAAGPCVSSNSPAGELTITVSQAGNQIQAERIKTEDVSGKNERRGFGCHFYVLQRSVSAREAAMANRLTANRLCRSHLCLFM